MNRGRILGDFLATQDSRPFDWATANCCHFAAAWVRFAEGVDPMAGTPTTTTATAALRVIQRLGGMQQAWSKQLGREPIHPGLAQVGDVVLMTSDGETGSILGICNGMSVIALDEHGHAHFLPVEQAECAWRVEIRPELDGVAA
jgi:hypothetical protein